jgi:methionine aminopeptidase
MEIDTVGSEQDVLSVDNLPTPSVLSKYRLAGHFCSVAIRTVLQQCIPGATCKDLCNVGDEAILAQVLSFSLCFLDWEMFGLS